MGAVLRKFALLASVCTVLCAGFASAQKQGDVVVGGGILMSFPSPNDLVTYKPLTETGGTYLSLGGDVIAFEHRLGINFETSWRYKQGSYYGYENFRPFFTDVNALYQPMITKKIGLDFLAGVGVASNRFDILTSCGIPGCTNYTSSNHFMEDIGAGVRYYVWHHIPHVFVRPEAHYYHIQNNLGFNTGNVFRIGASVGYTIGK
jgi:hypothetical protein